MLVFIIRRLVFGAVALLLLTYIVWFLTTRDGVVALHQFNLQSLLPNKYLIWLNRVLHGDLGFSVRQRSPVLLVMRDHALASLLLIVPAFLLQVALSLTLGLLAGARYRSYYDRAFASASFIFASIPSFWLSLLAIIFVGVQLHWFTFNGLVDLHKSGTIFNTSQYWVYFHANTGEAVLDIANHLVLPVLALTLTSTAADGQYVRLAIVEALNQDHIRAAKARGLSRRSVIWKHALRNAILPLITNIGIQIPRLVFAAVVIEYVFGIPGLGPLFINAFRVPSGGATVPPRDYDIISAYFLVLGVVALVATLITDLSYAIADPRIRGNQVMPAIAKNPLVSHRPLLRFGKATLTLGNLATAVVIITVSILCTLTVRQFTTRKLSVAGDWYGPVSDTSYPFTPLAAYFTVQVSDDGRITGTGEMCAFSSFNTKPLTMFTVTGNTDNSTTVRTLWDSGGSRPDLYQLSGAYPQADTQMALSGPAQSQNLSFGITVKFQRGSQSDFQSLCKLRGVER